MTTGKSPRTDFFLFEALRHAKEPTSWVPKAPSSCKYQSQTAGTAATAPCHNNEHRHRTSWWHYHCHFPSVDTRGQGRGVRQHAEARTHAPLQTTASYLLLLQLGDLLLHHGDLAVHAVHVLNELLLRQPGRQQVQLGIRVSRAHG